MKNFKRTSIRSKFNILIICVILFLMVTIGIVSKIQIKKQMMKIYEDRVAVESEQGLSILDEKYPGEWEIKNGELYKGTIKINDNNEIFEKIGETTGGLANVFLDNSTIATNIVVNGERRIGANAVSAIAEAVLEKGEVYTGQADISGKLYLTMYQPIKDENDKIIGMWLVGTPIDSVQDNIFSLLLSILITIACCGILAIIATFFITRSIVRPIHVVNKQLKEIADGEGDLTKEIQIQSRDELGEMAASFNKMLKTLRTMLNQVKINSEQVAASSDELLSSSEQSASATNQVVLSIQEVANTIEIQGKNTKKVLNR